MRSALKSTSKTKALRSTTLISARTRPFLKRRQQRMGGANRRQVKQNEQKERKTTSRRRAAPPGRTLAASGCVNTFTISARSGLFFPQATILQVRCAGQF